MTPSELNKICCDFAGIEPKNSNGAGVAWYPPVSTDWEAAGRLIDALKSNGVYALIRALQAEFCGEVRFGHRTVQGWASTGPMALCLAVAEFTKESAR